MHDAWFLNDQLLRWSHTCAHDQLLCMYKPLQSTDMLVSRLVTTALKTLKINFLLRVFCFPFIYISTAYRCCCIHLPGFGSVAVCMCPCVCMLHLLIMSSTELLLDAHASLPSLPTQETSFGFNEWHCFTFRTFSYKLLMRSTWIIITSELRACGV